MISGDLFPIFVQQPLSVIKYGKISYMPYSKPIVITYLCAETGPYQFHPPWRKRRIVTKHNIRHHPGQTGKYVVCYLRRTQ